MPVQLADLIAPGHTALVTQECQRGVLGEPAIFPALAEAARGVGAAAGRLAEAARAAGVPVIHCLALRRKDGLGANTNARLFGAAHKAPVVLEAGSDAAALVPELEPAETDLILTRLHGLGPMAGTDLDPILRNLGVETIVGVGVSVNVGMTNFVMDAVNAGYRFVLPRDATAGVPREYAEAVLDNTLSLLATVVTSDEVAAVWEAAR
jgi:nicotinamidase-related amidase